MKTFKIIFIVVASLLILVGTTFFVIGFFGPKPAGLRVETNSEASVYLNGILVGKTPFRGTHKSGEVALKIVPESSNNKLFPFETKLSLTAGIETVVRREFGATEEESSGDVITFEKEIGNETSLIVVSTPDNAQISIDGIARGFAPYKTSTISPAEHQITVKANGFSDRIMTVKIIPGFRLSVFAKLSKTKMAEMPTPVPQVIKTYVEILSTPTGYLRVRTEPGTRGSEIAQVKPGERYLFLEEDKNTGWFKIQYQEPAAGLPDGISGWVSNEFSRKIEVPEESTPSATF